jgi:zinc resistance-associated protein
MKMKKALLAVVLASAVGIIGAQQVLAKSPGPHGDGAPRFQQIDDATKAKIDKFQAETLDLRKQIAVKNAEERALMRSETPDMDAVRKAAGELFDLRMAMHEKAKAAGLNSYPRRGPAGDAKMTEERAKFDKFLTDTLDLRKQMSVKKAEERTLMHSRNANAGAVAKVAGELFDLRNTIHEKARAAGLAMPFHGMGKGDMGPRVPFRHGGGFGMMDCSGPQGPAMMGPVMMGADDPVEAEDSI